MKHAPTSSDRCRKEGWFCGIRQIELATCLVRAMGLWIDYRDLHLSFLLVLQSGISSLVAKLDHDAGGKGGSADTVSDRRVVSGRFHQPTPPRASRNKAHPG